MKTVDMKGHILYRIFDVDSQLLYVGMTRNLAIRLKTHASQKVWWCEVDSVAVEKFRSRTALSRAERRAIQNERPKYNIQKCDVPVHPVLKDVVTVDNSTRYELEAKIHWLKSTVAAYDERIAQNA